MRRTVFLSCSVIALGGLLAASASFYSYYGRGTLELQDGSKVDDVSVAEAGEFAGDDFEPIRRNHAERVAWLRPLPKVAVPTRDEEELVRLVDRLIRAEVERDGRTASDFSDDGNGSISDLSLVVGRVLAVLSGQAADEYVASLGDGVQARAPVEVSTVQVAVDRHGSDIILPPSSSEATGWDRAFYQLYPLIHRYRSGELLARSLIDDPSAFAVATGPLPQLHGGPLRARYGRNFEEKLTNAATQLQPVIWRGTAAGSAHDDDQHEHGSGLHSHQAVEQVKEAVVVFVMEDAAGDLYPIKVAARRTAVGPWTLTYVARLSSLRAMNGPPFFF